MGSRRSVSRVPGEEPRTSTPTTAPAGASKRTAVQPVRLSGSVACPTSTPGTSQRLPNKGSLRLRLLCVPLFGIGGRYAGVLRGEASQRHELALAALSAELDEDGVFYHRVVHDLALPAFELHGGVLEGGALLELLVDVVLVAHAALHLAAAAHDLLVRGNALLLGEPHVDGAHAARPAPGRAAQRQPARVAPARVPRALDKAEAPQRDTYAVDPLEALFDRAQVGVLLVGLVLDLDVAAVQRDVAAYELDLLYAVVAGELLGLVADLAPPLPVLVVLARVLLGHEADDVVGLGVGLAAPRRQGDAPDEVPHLGGDDYLVADPEVELPRVAEPRGRPAGDADVDEPGEGASMLCRIRDNATSRIASGETLYASAARASPRASAASARAVISPAPRLSSSKSPERENPASKTASRSSPSSGSSA